MSKIVLQTVVLLLAMLVIGCPIVPAYNFNLGGRVVDAKSGAQIEGATVILGEKWSVFERDRRQGPFREWARVQTDENGRFHWGRRFSARFDCSNILYTIIKDGYEPSPILSEGKLHPSWSYVRVMRQESLPKARR